MLFIILFHLRKAKVWKERARESGILEGSRAFVYGRMLVAQRRADDAEKGFAGRVSKRNWEMEY